MRKVSSAIHPTVLHGLKIQKCKKKENNKETDTKENKPEEVKCATTNTVPDVINVCVVLLQIKSQDTIKKVHTYPLLDNFSQDKFILDQLVFDFEISGRKTSLTIKTIDGEFTSNSTALEGFPGDSISRNNSE